MSNLNKKDGKRLSAALEKVEAANLIFSQPNQVLLVACAAGEESFATIGGLQYRKVEKRPAVDGLGEAIGEIHKLLGR